MKKVTLSTTLSLLLLVITLNSSCQQSPVQVKKISPDSLKQLLATEHGVLLDVRTPEEFAEGHIPGAINIDFRNPGFSKALDTLDKNVQYEVYCRSGHRSGESADLMQQKGFKKIYDLEGGILNWEGKGFETEK
jgi:rhodanese-related sulfurtransferase